LVANATFARSFSTVIASTETIAFRRGVRPVLRMVPTEKAKQIIQFKSSPALKRRVEQLAEKSSKGRLTTQERAEYAGYVRANKFIAILQRQARKIVLEARWR